MPSFYLLEQTRTLIPPTYGDEPIIAIKFFPIRVNNLPFFITAETPESALLLAKQSPFTRGRLIAVQEKTSYDEFLIAIAIAAHNRTDRILRRPAPPRARPSHTND